MDVFERVREANAGAELTGDQVSRARSRVLGGIDHRTAVARRRSARRPTYLIAGGIVGVAAITTAVLVVNHNMASPPRVEAVPATSAKPVPTAPSTPKPTPSMGVGAGIGVVEPFPGTTPQSGQYLEIRSTDESLVYQGQSESDAQLFHWTGAAAPVAAVVLRSVNRIYVPGDRTAEWVGRDGPANERVQIYPGGTVGDPVSSSVFAYRSEVQEWSFPGGIGGEIEPREGSLQSYAQYPTDPQALIRYFRDQVNAGGKVGEAAEQAVAFQIIGVLLTNYAPAQTRATFLKALELTEQTQITPTAGHLTTYSLHLVDDLSGSRTIAVTVDSATGWVVEYDAKWDQDGGAGSIVPPEVPGIHRTFTISIVDALP